MTGLIDTTASAALTGLRAVVDDSVGDAAVTAMRDAGAIVVTAVSARSDQVVAGDADIAVTADTAPVAVCIAPTAAALRTRLSVVASDLALANAAMTVLAADAPGRWPADVRLAAPPEPVIVVALDPHSRARDGVTSALSRAGARVVDGDSGALGHLTVPDGVDAVIAAPSRDIPDDLCSVTVRVDGSVVTVAARAFDDAVAVDIAASMTDVQQMQRVWPLSAADPVELVVFGAHLRDGPLTHQLTDLGGRWAGEITTAPRYRMTVLPTVPPKPAITRVPDDQPGSALYGHRWLMSAAALGRFLAALPAPMQLGKVEFDDGSWRTAFGCEAAAATGADISRYGSWPGAVAAGAVRSAPPG